MVTVRGIVLVEVKTVQIRGDDGRVVAAAINEVQRIIMEDIYE